jgi:hypothetical protein
MTMHEVDLLNCRRLPRTAVLAACLFAVTPSFASAQELTDAEKAISNVVTLGEAADAPTEWLGPTPHFVMVGEFGDYTFAINIKDPAKTENFKLEGKREYRKAEKGLDYIDFEIAVDLITNGIERGLEIEFENANFAAHPVPSTFALQDKEFPAGLFSNMELQVEWEWVEKSFIVNDEKLYSDGQLTVALEDAKAEADGTAPSGMIGGFVTGTMDGKKIAISFTAPVTEAEIDD